MADSKPSKSDQKPAAKSAPGASGKSGKDAQSHTKSSTGKGAGGGKKQERKH